MNALIESGHMTPDPERPSQLRWWLRRAMKRLPLILGIAGGASALAVAVALRLPAVYESQTQITVAASQIPQGIRVDTQAPSALEQLQLFQSRLLTRANLLDIARRLHVFAYQSDMSADQIVAAMRKATKITSSSGRDQATLMTISFDARRPDLAAGVVNAYLTVMLKDDVSLRTQQARGRLDFFRQEVAQLGKAQDVLGAKILAFKQSHDASLPDNLSYLRQQLSAAQTGLDQIGARAAQLDREQARLVQTYATTGSGGYGQSPAQRKLEAAQTALEQAQAVYSARNPRVQMLKAQVAVLQKAVAADQARGAGLDTTNPAAALVKLQLQDVQARKARLVEQRKTLKQQVVQLQAAIAAVPATAQALSELERNQTGLQVQYASAVKNLDAAQQAERIAALSRGQRISVLQQPAVPTDPIRPRRGLIALAGIAGGLAAGLALAVALEVLDRRLHRGEDLVRHLGITPLAVLPRTMTRRERLARQSRRVLGLVTLAGGMVLVFLALMQPWLPVARIMQVFGATGA